jgi:DNA-binding transcriptional regulator LsrR (DeoR family)
MIFGQLNNACAFAHKSLPMTEENQHELLAQIASMYYERDMTQNDIATRMGLSRVKVYRLLKQARAAQIVRITVNWPVKRDLELEAALKRSFDLQAALVLKTVSRNLATMLQLLGQLGARYLESMLTDGSTMAVCLGRTSYETIHAISPDFQARVRVAQAVGSMPSILQERDSAALARELAQKLGGEVLYLTSPLMGDTVHASAVIRSQRDIQRTLAVARDADVALSGIGNLDPAISGFSQGGFISSDELASFSAKGAVGDMAGQIYTLKGELYPCEYNERIIGITLEDLKLMPTTVAVAMGQSKGKAILGGLRTGAINVLCTDARAAAKTLQLNDGS